MPPELWAPLPDRLAGRDGLQEGVPAVLRRPLREWISAQVTERSGWTRLEIGGVHGVRLVERVRRRLGLEDNENPDVSPGEWLAYDTSDDDLLNIADAILALTAKPAVDDPLYGMSARMAFLTRTSSLQELLDDVRSAYTVRASGLGLERRAPAGASQAHTAAVRAAAAKPDAGSAASHLSAAWAAAYAITPEPVQAYSESVKAVEAAAHAVVEPQNPKATLGTMVRQLRDSPERFATVLQRSDSVGTVREMMSLLWAGQTSRHGGMEPTRRETPAEAQAAVQLAATLVGWFVSGAVRRADLPA